ncbi:MAG TPA: HAMP domain-containing sensor histidine kinase [Polyangia bacterium]|nr:HAMP domain-containing sensor histidine kinase [Polyangia bacterium]
MPRRLYARIYLHFLIMLVVVGPLSLGIFATGWRGAFIRASAERLAAHAASEVGDHWDDPAARLRTIRRLSDELNLDITVRDGAGRLLVAVGPELPAPYGRDRQVLREGPTIINSEGRVWFAAAPIFSTLDRNQDRRVVVPQGYLEAALQRRFRVPHLWRHAIVVGLVLLAVAIGAAPLARRISRPVERLTAATRRFGSGDLGYRLPPLWPWRKDDELGELTRAWNDMAERIETLVRGQKELLANVSHELRSPLARLRMALELLPVAPEGAGRVRDMEDDLGELERLIDDLLTASRLEARTQSLMPLHMAPVEAQRLLHTLSERASRDARFDKEPLRVDGAQDAAGLWARADVELLGRALWNLVENAAKYGAPPIRAWAERAGDHVRFHVRDEGPGIPEGERERVFEPFYRADRARTPGVRAGVGLGLTLARRIAEAHGGSIRIASGPDGRGCLVTIELPAADEGPAASA